MPTSPRLPAWFFTFAAVCAFSLAGCKDASDDHCPEGQKPGDACSCPGGALGVIECAAADGGASSSCDCSQGSGGTAGSGGGGDSGKGSSETDGGAQSGEHDASSSQQDDDDGGAGSGDPGSDAATSETDASTQSGADASTPAYDGPCTNDDACHGDEVCVQAADFSYCAAPCMEDKDCPAPEKGKATKTCVGANILLSQPGTCALFCGGLLGDKCPSGMECSDLLILSGTCAWKDEI